MQMLDRKEALLTALREMNVQAEALGQSAPVRCPTLYSPVFKQQYTWVVGALNKTNAALGPSLEKLRLMIEEEVERASGGKEGAELFALMYGLRVSNTVRGVINTARDNAHMLFTHHNAHRVRRLPGGSEGEEEAAMLQELIEACAGLILVLRQCADNRRQGAMSTADVDHCVSVALQDLKYRCPRSQRLFAEIESSVALLKSELLL
jgi:hypothetical protein